MKTAEQMNSNREDKNCYIVGAGESNPLSFIPKEKDLVIAADGGYDHLIKSGINPNIALGDFDSLGYIPKGIEIIKHPAVKNDTDTMLAVKYAYDLGYRRFVFFCCLGNALDHTLANIQIGQWLSNKNAVGIFAGNGYCLTTLKNGKIEFDEKCKGRISVFSVGSKALGVTEKGLRYSLDNAEISTDFPLGVSNEFTGKKSIISVDSGTLLIFWEGKFTDCTHSDL